MSRVTVIEPDGLWAMMRALQAHRPGAVWLGGSSCTMTRRDALFGWGSPVPGAAIAPVDKREHETKVCTGPVSKTGSA